MRNQNEKDRVLNRRLMFIVLLNLLAFVVIAVRLYYLQIMEADKYRVMSEENRISTRFLVPPRGMIYDRNGEILAKNNQDFQALLIAEQTNDISQTVATFQKLLPLSEEEDEKVAQSIKNRRRFIPIKLKSNLQWDEVSKIMLNAPDLPGIEINEGLNRFYP